MARGTVNKGQIQIVNATLEIFDIIYLSPNLPQNKEVAK